MPQGDPGEHFGGTMGYGGQFPGYGGSRGYTGGQNNPSSSGGGTAGQTQASQHYAGLIRGYAPGGVAGSIGMGGVWSPAKTTSSQNPDLPQNKPGVKVSGKKPPPKIDPVTGLPTLTPAQIAAGVVQEQPPVPSETVPRGYWGSGPGPIHGGPPVPGGFGGFGVHPSSWGSGYGDTGGDAWGNAYGNYGVGTGLGGDMLGGGRFNANQVNLNSAAGIGQGSGRQFGGPVAPGRQYTVGENGPETLQMRPGGGGQVIPNNQADAAAGGFQQRRLDPGNSVVPPALNQKPQLMNGGINTPGFGGGPGPQPVGGGQYIVDPVPGPEPTGGGLRGTQWGSGGQSGGGSFQGGGMQQPMQQPNNQPLGGLNPQMMQQWLQLLQQRQQGQPGGGMQQPPMPQRPPMSQSGGGGQRPQTQGPGGSFRLGDWRNRMGIEGLSRPPSSMGFGGSGLGMPGVMPHLANRGGLSSGRSGGWQGAGADPTSPFRGGQNLAPLPPGMVY